MSDASPATKVTHVAQKADAAVDATVGASGLSMPFWIGWIEEGLAMYGAAIGGVVLTLRAIKIIRDWKRPDTNKSIG